MAGNKTDPLYVSHMAKQKQFVIMNCFPYSILLFHSGLFTLPKLSADKIK